MNKKGMMLLPIATFGFMIGLILLITSNTDAAGHQAHVGEVQKESLNEYEALLSQKYSVKENAKSISSEIILELAQEGIDYTSACDNWETSDCVNKPRKEFKKRLKQRLKQETGYEYEVDLKNSKILLTTDQRLTSKKEKTQVSIDLNSQIPLEYDFSDYNKIAHEIKRKADCVLNTPEENCFKDQKFEYIVNREQKLIKYEVTTGKIITEEVQPLTITFRVDKQKLEQERITF